VNNPRKILKTLDANLQSEVRLILYGRAALVLGFEDSPQEFGATMDVDPQDRSDIKFLLQQSDVQWSVLEKMLPHAQVPDIPELQEAYEANRHWLNGIMK